MISAIQTKLQKHNKIVFIVLLAIIIVAFVFTIGAAPGLGGAQKTARADYFGYNLQSERDVRELTRIGEISFRLEYGDQQANPNQFQNYVLNRVAYLELADQLQIPPPTEEELRHFVTGRSAFQDEEGAFDPTKYSGFIDDVEANPQTSTGEVAWVLEQDYRIDKARELVSGPGYVLPTEVRLQLERNQTLWSMDLATLNLAEFQPEIQFSDEELQTFFDQNAFRYEREPRTDFSYVTFSPENFLDQVKQLPEEEVVAHFEENRDQFKPEEPAAAEEETGETDEAKEEEEPKEVTLADVREEVEASLRDKKARRLAGVAAADFAYALFKEGVRPGSTGFEEVLTAHGGKLQDAPPASPTEFPAELRFPRTVQEAVFRLNEDRDFSDPLQLRDDYIVLLYEETLPSYIPELEEVREAVERDYRNEERRRLLAEKGQEIRKGLVKRIEEGATFTEAAEAEGLTTQSVEDFTRISPPQEVNRQLVARLDEFEQKEVSQMISLQNFGYFVYLTDKKVPEIDPSSDEFVRTADNLRNWSSMGSSNSVIQEFIQRETVSTQAEETN